MNINKLYLDLSNKKYTDVELLIGDDTKEIRISVHKLVLAYSSDFFDRLFTFGMEKNQTCITLKVDNADIANDVILSFYGLNQRSINYPDWKYQLKYYKCRSYFGIQNDPTLLYNMKIPTEGFDLLMNVIEEYDYSNDHNLIKLIKENIPIDFNLNNFTVEFINELLKIRNYKIISQDASTSIKIWDLETGIVLDTNKYISSFNCETYLTDGSLLLSQDLYNIFDKINIEFSILLYTTGGYVGRCFNPILLSKHKTITVLSGYIKIWNTETGMLLHILKRCTDSVRCAAISINECKIAFGYDIGTIEIWDAETGILLHKLNKHITNIYCVVFTTDNRLVSGSYDNSIKIWNIETGNLLQILNGHTKVVSSVAISSDNHKIVSGSHDKTIKIWDMESGILIQTLNEHTGPIYCVALSADNSKIVSGGQDKSIKIWDAESGDLLQTLNEKHHFIKSVAFSKLLYSAIDEKLKDYLNKHINVK